MITVRMKILRALLILTKVTSGHSIVRDYGPMGAVDYLLIEKLHDVVLWLVITTHYKPHCKWIFIIVIVHVQHLRDYYGHSIF